MLKKQNQPPVQSAPVTLQVKTPLPVLMKPEAPSLTPHEQAYTCSDPKDPSSIYCSRPGKSRPALSFAAPMPQHRLWYACADLSLLLLP